MSQYTHADFTVGEMVTIQDDRDDFFTGSVTRADRVGVTVRRPVTTPREVEIVYRHIVDVIRP